MSVSFLSIAKGREGIKETDITAFNYLLVSRIGIIQALTRNKHKRLPGLEFLSGKETGKEISLMTMSDGWEKNGNKNSGIHPSIVIMNISLVLPV